MTSPAHASDQLSSASSMRNRPESSLRKPIPTLGNDTVFRIRSAEGLPAPGEVVLSYSVREISKVRGMCMAEGRKAKGKISAKLSAPPLVSLVIHVLWVSFRSLLVTLCAAAGRCAMTRSSWPVLWCCRCSNVMLFYPATLS
jgi:hypothetical protein